MYVVWACAKEKVPFIEIFMLQKKVFIHIFHDNVEAKKNSEQQKFLHF